MEDAVFTIISLGLFALAAYGVWRLWVRQKGESHRFAGHPSARALWVAAGVLFVAAVITAPPESEEGTDESNPTRARHRPDTADTAVGSSKPKEVRAEPKPLALQETPAKRTKQHQETPATRVKRRVDPVVRERRFFEQMDNDAIALDDAIGQALDDQPEALTHIARIREHVLMLVNQRLLRGAATSVGGNLLLSAATDAREGARAGNYRRLIDARLDIADARETLINELIED